MHGFLSLIASACIAFAGAGLAALLATRLGKLLSLPKAADRTVATACILAALFGSFFGLGALLDEHDQGGIQKLFIVDERPPVQITLWLTRIHSKRVGASYDQLIKTFDLESGRILGVAEMAKKCDDGAYSVYWNSGGHAWGRSRHTGVQYLDLKTPRVISEGELIGLNPRLRQGFEVDAAHTIDPVTHGLRIITNNRVPFQIDPDLKLKPVARHHAASVRAAPTKWHFRRPKGTLGYNLHAGDAAPSKQSALLLKPEVIEELNPQETFDRARWISHPSALYGTGEPLISYIAADGRQLEQIRLKTVINKKARAICTYCTDRYAYVFVSSGKTLYADIKGFTLVALKTDKVTGEVLKKIRYF
jgi:hypothetical protein